MKWFRFYTEVLEDPKVQQLHPKLFRNWVNLMCLCRANGDVLPQFADIAFRLRLDDKEARATLQQLTNHGLVELCEDGSYQLHNWHKRQYKSDNGTERVKRFRNGQRNVSLNVSETATETHSDTDTDTDTEIVPNGTISRVPLPLSFDPQEHFRKLWQTHPGRSRYASCLQAYLAIVGEHPKPEPLAARVLASCEEWGRYWQATGRSPTGLYNWLHDGDWEQTPPPIPANGNGGKSKIEALMDSF